MPTLLDTLAGNPDYDILVNLVVRVDAATGAGLQALLANPELNATLFAPTDDAFISAAQQLGYEGSKEGGAQKHLDATFEALGGDDAANLLLQVLTYHVSPTVLSDADLADGAPVLNLAEVPLTVSGNTLVDQDPEAPNAVFGPIQTLDNGALISVDQVLLPLDIEPDASSSNDADLLLASDGDDVVDLLDSDDVFNGGAGDDFVTGDKGDDLIYGAEGDDTLIGEKGDDCLHGNEGDDRLLGLRGDDRLTGNRGDDFLDGGLGNDNLNGGSGDDFVNGGQGDDSINGNSGDDDMLGGEGDDRMKGQSGDDSIFGGSGEDFMLGGRGDDSVAGGVGDDNIRGESGDDFVRGGTGNDRVAGNSGDDSLEGNDGDDILLDGIGNDTVDAGEGDDELRVSSGDDQLTTGEGFDTLVFATEDNGANVVTDFNVEEDTLSIELTEGGELSILSGQGEEGIDTLITSSSNEDWSVLLLGVDSFEEEDLNIVEDDDDADLVI